ncbi:MAG: putative Ig domain-containing protein, partial [Kiritimatiellae bacterium]|nr:putative Ig domain-containing protein [Kiritimatiellia bacterium]
MKTILRFFALSAIAALVCAAPALATSSGGNYTLAWGGNGDGQLDIPARALSNATQIAVGALHCLALVDGRVYGWGCTNEGALSFPSSLQNIVFVAAGDNSGIAIRNDGQANFWGGVTNYDFRTYVPTGDYYVSASLGHDHGLLLTDAGAVRAWGDPEGDFTAVTIPNAEWKSGFSAVAAGRGFSMGLATNGIVYVAAPANDPYKLGGTNIPAVATQIDPRTRKGPVTAIAAGPYHAMALTTNGEVLVWGAWCEDEDDYDPTAGITSKRRPTPRNSYGNVTNVPPAALSGIVSIAAGYNMCAALTEAGQVVVWGMEESEGSAAMADVPAYARQDIKEIGLGNQHVLVRSAWLPPEFTGSSLPDARLESEYTATVPVKADPAATITVGGMRPLPAGLSLAPNGVFSGMPKASVVPVTNTFTLVASNIYGVATQQFSLVVRERLAVAPEWITTEIPAAVVGFPYSFQLEATESPTFSADEQLPGWLTLSSSGLLSGTPAETDAGTAYPTFTIANDAGVVSRLFQVAVDSQSADTPPIINRESIPDLLVGIPSSIDLQIVGANTVSLSGDLSASFRIVSSNGTWILTGTPDKFLQGDGRTAVVVAANSGASATKEYSVNVKGAPSWVTTSLPDATVGTPYEVTLVANFASSYEVAQSSLRPIPLALSIVTNEDASVVAVLSGTPTNTV